jgi:hypothetical protein
MHLSERVKRIVAELFLTLRCAAITPWKMSCWLGSWADSIVASLRSEYDYERTNGSGRVRLHKRGSDSNKER